MFRFSPPPAASGLKVKVPGETFCSSRVPRQPHTTGTPSTEPFFLGQRAGKSNEGPSVYPGGSQEKGVLGSHFFLGGPGQLWWYSPIAHHHTLDGLHRVGGLGSAGPDGRSFWVVWGALGCGEPVASQQQRQSGWGAE